MPDPEALHDLAVDMRVVIGQVARRLREKIQLGDLTWSQIKVIHRLDRHGPATVTGLAQAEGVRSQSMGETVAVLKAAGWVLGAPNPDDGRQTVLFLTEDCRQTLAAERAAREDWLLEMLQTRFSAEEQYRLADSIDLFKRLVEQ